MKIFYNTLIFICTIQTLLGQFQCPDTLIYGIGGISTAFVRVYNPRIPLSATNPSNTIIPNPSPGYNAGITLNPNINSSFPSPTLYATLANGNYCYWNGSSWVDTGHLANSQFYPGGARSIGGCNGRIYSFDQASFNLQTADIYVYSGTGPGTFLVSASSTGKFYHEVLADCHCNFYLLSVTELKKYSPTGVLVYSAAVTGLPFSSTGSAGLAFSIIGNTITASPGSSSSIGIYTASIGSSVNFGSPAGASFDFGSYDFASCPITTIVSTPLSINSGSFGCNPASINLTASATLSPLSYYWSGPGIGTSVLSGSIQNVSLPGTYTCNVTQTGCDYILATVVSTVVSNTTTLNPQIFPANQLCLSPFMQLHSSLNSGAYSYQWAGASIANGAQTPSVTLNAAGVYTLNVTDTSNGCTGVATASILQSPLLSMGISSPTLCIYSLDGKDKAILTYSGAATYTLLVSPGFSVQFIPSQPVVLFQTPPFASIGTAGSATLVGSNGVCTTSILTNFSVMPLTEINAVSEKTIVCHGDNIALIANGATNYSFSPSANITGINNGTVMVNMSEATLFSITGTDANGCSTNPKTIFVDVYPLHSGKLFYPQLLCAPICAEMNFIPTDTIQNKITSTWTVDGVNYSNTKRFKHCFSEEGEYQIVGTLTDSIHKCSNTVSYTVHALPKPIADFTYTPQVPVESFDEVKFSNSSVGDEQLEWNWFISGAQAYKSKGSQSAYLFQNAGVYAVALLVKNGWGCSDTVVKAITVTEDFLFYMPNSFTPNDDNRNEIFLPVCRGIKSINFTLFNRWGQLLFETNDATQGWDGSYQGNPSKQDTYIWKVNLTTKGGEIKKYNGYVLLTR